MRAVAALLGARRRRAAAAGARHRLGARGARLRRYADELGVGDLVEIRAEVPTPRCRPSTRGRPVSCWRACRPGSGRSSSAWCSRRRWSPGSRVIATSGRSGGPARPRRPPFRPATGRSSHACSRPGRCRARRERALATTLHSWPSTRAPRTRTGSARAYAGARFVMGTGYAGRLAARLAARARSTISVLMATANRIGSSLRVRVGKLLRPLHLDVRSARCTTPRRLSASCPACGSTGTRPACDASCAGGYTLIGSRRARALHHAARVCEESGCRATWWTAAASTAGRP